MKEAFGGLEFGLNEVCFPSPVLDHKLKVIMRQQYCIRLATSLEKIYSGILVGVTNLKYETLVCKRNCNDIYFLLASYFNSKYRKLILSETKEIHSVQCTSK